MTHFTVEYFVAWSLHGSEAGVNIVKMQTSVLSNIFFCNIVCERGKEEASETRFQAPP